MLGGNRSIEDIKALLYISKSSANYSELIFECLELLKQWQTSSSSEARQIVTFCLQNCVPVAQEVYAVIIKQLKGSDNIICNLQLLNGCATPAFVDLDLINQIWAVMGNSEDGEVVEEASKVLVNSVQIYGATQSENIDFRLWWQHIVALLKKSTDKRFALAGLKVWLACVCYLSSKEVVPVIIGESESYFQFLRIHLSHASKFALQILENTLRIAPEINNEHIRFAPSDPGVKDAWSRYLSLMEILGIDTSVHQTMDSLSDFAALLSKNSPIPANWLIPLITVGAINSNTEGIRTMVIQLILEARVDQLTSLAVNPEYLAQVLYPRFLQTPSFVIINERCLHAEGLEAFTKNILQALIASSLENLRTFMYSFAHYLLEHCHGFEAPRVLIVNAMLEVLPAGSLSSRETIPLLAAAKATMATYTSKAMADLLFTKVTELTNKVGPFKSESVPADPLIDAKLSLQEQGFLERSLFLKMIDQNISTEAICGLTNLSISAGVDKNLDVAESLVNLTWPLQVARLCGERLDQATLLRLLTKDLTMPKAWSAIERRKLSLSVELTMDQLDVVDFRLCELTFEAFNDTSTRLAALRCYKRQKDLQIDGSCLKSLWINIKEVTLRIIDRDLHHEFIDLLTDPESIDMNDIEDQQEICCEIIEFSMQRRNLLVPLALGLQRFSGHNKALFLPVMVRIFVFVHSKEYTTRLNEQVAYRFDVYHKSWGAPESQARGIAAAYLSDRKFVSSDSVGVMETTELTLKLAKLDQKITGSLDNIEAHVRVLYYQVFILIQDLWPRTLAIEIMHTARKSLENEANPPVRVHAEWLIGLIGVTHLLPNPEATLDSSNSKEFVEFVLEKINELDLKFKIPPRILGSLIRITLLLYFSFGSAIEKELLKSTTSEQAVQIEKRNELGISLLEHLIPLATSNKAIIRHRAISAIYILSHHDMIPESMKCLAQQISSASEAGVKGSGYQNEAYLWDVHDTSLGLVCGGVCSTVFDRYMPNTLIESDFDLVDSQSSSTPHVGTCWSENSRLKLTEPTLPELVAYREAFVREAVVRGANERFSTHIQTKSGTFGAEYRARRTQLIIVATLCDKPVNLGAICRLSDALGAKELVVKNLEVTSDHNFATTALTAEKWMPLSQVEEVNLLQFLREKKSEGYTLVGIEQTDTSKILRPNLQFPEKTLLMMGHEKKGIPAHLLAILDSCVEIEQLGFVRSMNIQTATAVVVHAYNQNHSPAVLQVGYQ